MDKNPNEYLAIGIDGKGRLMEIPHSRAIALKRIQQEKGITKSDFVRRAIDHELMAMA